MANFDAPALAKTLTGQMQQLNDFQIDLEKDPMANAARDIALQQQAADKIHAELDPVWNNPAELRSLGFAFREQGAAVCSSNNTFCEGPNYPKIDLMFDAETGIPKAISYYSEPSRLIQIGSHKISGYFWTKSESTEVYVGPRLGSQLDGHFYR